MTMRADMQDDQLIIRTPGHVDRYPLVRGSYGRRLVVFSTEETLDDFLWETGYRGPLYCYKSRWYNAISAKEFTSWTESAST